MKYLHAFILILTLIIGFGCSSGSNTPVTPSSDDAINDTLNRAADALERGNLDECLKYFCDPENNGKSLERLRNQWKMIADALKNAEIEESDNSQVRLKLKLRNPRLPNGEMESRIFLLKDESGKWRLSVTPMRHRKIEDRNAQWGTNTAHGSFFTRAIIEYYLRNYPEDIEFTGANGFLNQGKYKYPVSGTHSGAIDTILGIYDVDTYENCPPDAIMVKNAPSACMQMGAIDEDVFLGEYDSSMSQVFDRSMILDWSNGIRFDTSNTFGDSDDTLFKGYAHFLTPVNQDYIQNSFIGFNDMGMIGDETGHSAPAHRWGLGMENIGPVNIIDIVDMRENWNRKTWQNAIQLYKDAMKETNPIRKGEKLGSSFYALGHVIHLLEDCGIPAHVRNDMHGVPALSYIPGLGYLQPDPLEDWSDTFSSGLMNKSISLYVDLYRENNPIERYPNGFAGTEPLLAYYYNNAELPEYAGYEAIFKSLAFMTNRTFFSEDTFRQSTQSYANTSQYPSITSWDFNYAGRTVIYGNSGLPFDSVDNPLGVSTLWFDTWCTGFWTLHWRWPELNEVVDTMSSDGDLFTVWDDWDDDFFTDGRRGVCEAQWEVQFKRVVRHGAALLHEFYLETHK
jgi:hypothetical protein